VICFGGLTDAQKDEINRARREANAEKRKGEGDADTVQTSKRSKGSESDE
jgi:hypothetical protein